MTTDPMASSPAQCSPSFAASEIPRASISYAAASRLLFIFTILALEAIITPAQTARQLEFVAGSWWQNILVQQVGGRLRYFALTSAAMTMFLSWNTLRTEALRTLN